MVNAKQRVAKTAGTIVRYAAGAAAIILFVFPLVWLLKASFNKPIDAITLPPVWIFRPMINNYLEIFRGEPFLRFLKNSVLVCPRPMPSPVTSSKERAIWPFGS